MAITTGPPKGIDGMLMSKAMAKTAPRPAPDETPRVPPSARGFLKSPCMAAPARERHAPTRQALRTLGNLTARIIDALDDFIGVFKTWPFKIL